MGGEDKVLGGHVISIAPLHSFFQLHLGGPERRAADRLLYYRCWEVGCRRWDPVETLIGKTVQGGLAAGQYVRIPDRGVRAQVGPIVGGGEILKDTQFIDLWPGRLGSFGGLGRFAGFFLLGRPLDENLFDHLFLYDPFHGHFFNYFPGAPCGERHNKHCGEANHQFIGW